MSFETVNWKNGHVVLIDQTVLPHVESYIEYSDPEKVAQAIENMVVRGAPAIGVTTAYGLALAAENASDLSLAEARKIFDNWKNRFSKTRPTAVNLFWAIEEMGKISDHDFSTAKDWANSLLENAKRIHAEDLDACKQIGENGAALLPEKVRVLTHCNAGALATSGWGTALGVIRSAAKNKKEIEVWVDETRPFLQGSRLTSWELMREGIPATLITDNMSGFLMSRGEVDTIIVGADRIAANGDVANKIGTYTLAVLAKANHVPFYVAAPLSTIDMACRSGLDIPIEERDPNDVTELGGIRLAPQGMKARHPAFDVTPNHLVSAIITEKGVVKSPYLNGLKALFTTAG